jgi:hypothetical protein
MTKASRDTVGNQDSFIMTSARPFIYRDWQKTRHLDPSLPLWAGSDGT